MAEHLQEKLNREPPQSVLQTAVNATEPGYGYARSSSTMEAELQLQDTPVSPDSRVRSSSGSALSAQVPGQPSKTTSQAAENGNTLYKSATLASPYGIFYGTKIADNTMRSAPGERENDHVERATSLAGRACERPPNTPKTGNEAAGALELATRLHALLSELPKLGITDKDGKVGVELSDASLSLPPTDKDAERSAVHCEKEHNNANVTATPEGSISLITPRNTPVDGPNASRLAALLSELQRLRCSLADQERGDSDGPSCTCDGPSCTCEFTDSMPSPDTSLSEHDALYFAFADISTAFPVTTGMVLIDEQCS